MHQQEETVNRYTEQHERLLKEYVHSALSRVTHIHLRRFPRIPPELYKVFIGKSAQKILNLGPNIEKGFKFEGMRAVLYTSKPEAPLGLSYVSCETQGVRKELGSQSVLYLEEPTPPEPVCIIK